MGHLQLNARYSRDEISALLGGSRRDALPLSGGRVVCGCFKQVPKYNPKAPAEIAIGRTKTDRPLRAARTLECQKDPIPVFLWRASASWEFVGFHRLRGYSEARKVTSEKQQEDIYRHRGRIAAVFYLDLVNGS